MDYKYLCATKEVNINKDTKIGVLGGGQLGRMLVQEATKMDLDLWFMDKDFDFPVAAIYPNFVKGDFQSYDDVISFGSAMDVITIEIENVNTDALKALEASGKKVIPQARVIELIKDKGLQKQFYQENSLPTSEFFLVESANEIRQKVQAGTITYPFVQKSRIAGYDGKGVAAIRAEDDLEKLIDAPSVIEELINIRKELAVIVGRNEEGQITCFPTTEMVFNPKGNLLDYLLCPAVVSSEVEEKCKSLAKQIIEKLDMIGILAVEFFLTKENEILINEVAPRPHNSGHHTIDVGGYSQYNLHLRTLLNLPLLPVYQEKIAAMINLLGSGEQVGPATYIGLEKVLELEGVFPHLYGKKITKPLRKMGHVNILGNNMEEVLKKIDFVKSNLTVVACQQ